MRRAAAALAATLALAGCGSGSGDATTPAPADPFATPSAGLAARASPPRRQDGLLVSAVSYAGAHGDRVAGLLARPADGPAGDCVLFQGGLGSSKEDAAAVWPVFAAQGAATFTVDAREQGRAADPDRLAAAGRDPRRLRALFADTVGDLRRGVDWLTTDGGCRRVSYVGFSFGGLVGAMLAGADERVGRVVLVSAGGDWPVLLRASTVLAPGFRGRAAERDRAARLLAPLDPARWVARIAPRPLLLVNGDADAAVPPAAATALRRAAPDAEVVRYPGGHDPFAGPDRDRVVAAITRFLRPA